MTCKRSKPLNQKPYGLLHSPDIPTRPWESIGIDFVGPLPISKDWNGEYNSITVIIDLLTGMVHLVPSRIDYSAKEVAELIFVEVYKHHGLPKKIISDRDTLFTSMFWTHLKQLIGVEQRLSSTYHPQTDRSTERANRTIGQMLQSCIGPNQQDWVGRLPGIEFAINVSRSETTGYAPFFLNSGRLPRAFIWNSPTRDEYPSVWAFAQRMKQAVMEAHNAILETRVKQTRSANRKHQTSPFKNGDLAYISTKNISFPKGQARKLVPRYIGPYKITEDYGNNSYKLDLPARLKQRSVHPVFHSSLLRIHVPNDDHLFPRRLETQVADFGEPDSEWQVDRILSHSGSGQTTAFEVRWTSRDVTWLPYEQIKHLSALTDYLQLLEISGIQELTRGDGTPPSNDPQISCGSCAFGRDRSYHSMQPCPPPSHRDLHPSKVTRLDYENIYQSGEDFAFRVNERYCTGLFIPRAHLRLCLEFSIKIRTLVRADHLPPMLVGYDSIAQIFNLEPSNPYRLSVIGDNGRCVHSDYPEPSPTYLFGPPAQEAPPVATDPQVGEIGSWLIDRELWKNKKIKEEREHRGMRRGPEGREMAKEEQHEEEARMYGGRNRKRRPRGQKGPEHDEGRKRTRRRRSAEYRRDRTPAVTVAV